MDIYKLLSPFFIFIVMICALLPGAYPKKHLGRSENFAIKSGQWEKGGVSSSPFELFKNTKRKRALRIAEPNTEMECPQKRGTRSLDEMAKCPETFCQHVSYRCNMQCPETDTGAVVCELYNCTGTHHCSSANEFTIPIEEVCDNIDQCPDSDDESTCVKPCWPSCMCIGLMVNYRDTNLDISGFHFNNMFNVTNQNEPQSVGVLHLSYLSYLEITDIHTLPDSFIRGFYNLKSLDVSNNKITFLTDDNFRDISSLVSLDLSSNRIHFLSNNVFNGLSHLIDLDLSHNQIKYLPDNVFSGLSLLAKLDLSRNQIIDLPENVISTLSLLTELDLSSNQILYLPDNVLSGLSSLTKLDLSINQIIDLPDNVFNGLSALTDLDLGHNQIVVLPDNLFNELPALTYLDLGHNQIVVLPDNLFNGLPALTHLNLGHNQIVALPDNVLSSLPVIEIILLNGNKLSALPALPFSVQVLDISYNSFTNLHNGSFINNSNMSLLSVIGNDLEVKKYMFKGLNNLKTLLTDTPFMCCVKPKSVSIDKCIQTTVFDPDMLSNCFERHTACKSEVDAISSCDALIGSGIQRACLWIIGGCALVGNIIVFFYRLFIERGNITQSYSLFVLNLCISDFLMGVYLLIIGVADVYYNGVYAWNDREWRRSIVCTTAGVLSTISSEMSTFLILLVTIDRVIVIAFPMSRLSRWSISWKQATIISVSLWFVSITLGIIPIVAMQSYFKGEYYSQSGVCLALPLTSDKRPGAEYSFAVFVCLNCIIFVVIVIGQICIFKSIVTSGGRMTSSKTRQRDMSVARTLFMVVATDFFCWFPIGVMGVLSKSGYNIPDDAYAWIMVFVLPVNAAINPFLYTATAIWRKRQREKRRAEMISSKRGQCHY